MLATSEIHAARDDVIHLLVPGQRAARDGDSLVALASNTDNWPGAGVLAAAATAATDLGLGERPHLDLELRERQHLR
eukprot:964326-Pyramimonas_sp.AAC.1